MNEFYIRNVVEAALLAAGKPLQLAELGQLFEETTRPKVDDLRAALDALAAEYSSRGVEVKETAAGFRIQVRKEFSAEISRLWPERPAKYSRALLETLALIAYRQPITRAEIEAVRGVAVNPNIVKQVIERNWVRVVGHRDVPGRPELLGTTREFLDYFGLRSLDELPPLAELKAMGDYNLQLELPNAGALGVEPKADGGLEGEGGALVEGDGTAVAVAALLTGESEAATEVTEVASVEAASGEAANGEIASAETASAETANGEVASAEAVGGEVANLVTTTGEAADGEVAGAVTTSGEAVDSAFAQVAHSQSEVAMTPDSTEPVAVAHESAGDTDVDSDAEVDRTLSVVAKHAESNDAEAAGNATAGESSDVLDDAVDDDADEDELSADGDSSRELVAAPRDLDN